VLRTSLKSLRAHKLRLLTTGIAVLLGVAFMSGSLVLTDTISRTFNDLFAEVSAGTDAYVRGEEAFESEFGESVRPRIDESLLEEVAAVDGVAAVAGDVMGYTQIVGADGKAIGDPANGAPTYGGAWTAVDALNPFTLSDGRAPAADDEVVIDRKSAKDGDLEVGMRTTVLTQSGATEVVVVGIARFGSVDSPGGASFASFTLPAAQRLIAEPGRLDGIGVVADDGVSRDELVERLSGILPDGTEAVTGDVLTKENQDAIAAGLSFFGTFLLVFALIALFVGSFIIYNTFSIIVAQRMREMALLRAIGASRRQVLASIMVEALVVGIVASTIGLLAGIGVAGLLKGLLTALGFDIPSTGTVVTGGTVATALITGIGVTVVAALAPARRASRIPPIAAMRDVAIERTRGSRTRLVLSGLLTAAGSALIAIGLTADTGNPLANVGFGALLVFLGVGGIAPLFARPATRLLGAPLPVLRGITGELARENAMRNPKRTSRTAAALMIGVALVGFITILSSSVKASIDKTLDEQYTGDFVVDSGSFGFGGLSPELARALKEKPELDAVAAIRSTPARFDGRDGSLFAIDAPDMQRMVDVGVVEGSLDDLDETGLAVHVDKAEAEGWTIGSRVPVRFADTGDGELEVRVIYENRQLAGNYFVGLPVFDANVTRPFDLTIFVKISEGATPEAARAAIEEETADYATADVQDRREFKEAQGAQIDQMVNLIYGLLLLAIVIAVLGIMNTLTLSIVERTRELGLLRAVGMTRGQLRSVVRYESVLISLFGVGLGLVIGLFFGWALVRALADEGFSAFRVPVGGLAVITLVATGFGVLAAVWPAWRASRMDVLAAIATE
jgi:putative ABC transport system permease protein